MAEDHFQEEGMERQDTREAGEKAPAKEPCDFLNVVRMATEKLSKEVSKKLSHHELETPYKINPVNSARINLPDLQALIGQALSNHRDHWLVQKYRDLYPRLVAAQVVTLQDMQTIVAALEIVGRLLNCGESLPQLLTEEAQSDVNTSM
jgi:hypothetical protein